ncbi:MAG: Fic/DOC family N-terminal domain-containing protein [Bacteroidales bacterium]|jgi:Fic family protein|nr:Fic/DOC family N-terminal domain-containing protein [Bacteroidales bacterium]
MSDFAEPYERTKPYNNLPLLPPEDDKVETKEVFLALNNANKALAELKGIAKKLPNQSMLVSTIALREAKASTEIENKFTTDDELYKALTISEYGLKGNAKEVLRYRQALWKGYHDIVQEKSLRVETLIEIYKEIKQVDDGIRPPQTETVILKRGSGQLTGEVVYTPPRGTKIIQQKLNNLVEYINNDTKFPYDPLLKIAISHYQFEAIHPFRDGNGRAGRILSILLMIQKRLLEVPILYLSSYIIREKDEYYELLKNVTSHRKWIPWIIYMLKAIEETSKYTISKIEEIDSLFTKISELVSEKYPAIRKEFIEKLFEQPYLSPRKLLDRNMKSVNTAKKYLKQLEEIGVLIPKKIGKEVVYLNIDLYNILSDS